MRQTFCKSIYMTRTYCSFGGPRNGRDHLRLTEIEAGGMELPGFVETLLMLSRSVFFVARFCLVVKYLAAIYWLVVEYDFTTSPLALCRSILGGGVLTWHLRPWARP